MEKFFSRSVFLLAAILIGILLVSSPGWSASAPSRTWTLRCNTLLTETAVVAHTFKWYAEELNKRSGGRVKIEIYWGGALGGPMDNLKLTGDGIIDIGYIYAVSFPKEMPLTSSLGLPMLTTKTDIMMNVHTELYNTYSPLKEECEVKNNVVLLFSNTQSLPVGAARMPIRSVSDLQGKKLRTVGRVTEVLKKLGGSPVGMQSTEIYEAARKGVIDGVAALPFTDLGKTYGGLYETMPYIFDWGLGNYSGGTFLAMSLKRFNEFPKDIQKIIEELRDEAPAFSAKANAESNIVALKEYEAAKCNIYMWTPQEMEKARALIVPSIWDNVTAEIEKGQPGVPIREYLGKVHALVGKYEKQVKFVHPLVK